MTYATSMTLSNSGRSPDKSLVLGTHLAWLQITRTSSRREEYNARLQIEQYGTLMEDWDGYGGLPITAPVVNNAIRALNLICLVAPVPDVTPNSNGTLSFEWESGHGVGHLEIGQTKISFYIKPTRGAAVLLDDLAENLGSAAFHIGNAIVHWLYPEISTNSTTSMSRLVNVSYTH